MGAGVLTDVLLALLDAPDADVGGTALQHRLARCGRQLRSDELLVALLRLETTDHVRVERGPQLRFSLTDSGRARAYELGGGRPVHVRLLMADLVGFVSFTTAHGDGAAHEAARGLAGAAAAAVRDGGGEVVKGMGDGFLAWLPPTVDPLPVVASLADRCVQPSGERWRVRAASHVGHPIRHGGDLYGGDVNLVARLCEAAAPDELVVSHPHPVGASHRVEHLLLRGMADAVPVARVAIA
jgi:class 3 adenylate cyclase